MFNFSSKKLEELQKILEEKQKEIDLLQEDRVSLKAKNKTLSQENQTQAKGLLAAQAVQVTLEEKLQLLQDEIKAFTVKNKKLVKDNNANYESFLVVKDARDKLKAELAELKAALANEKALKDKLAKENNENFNNYKKLKTLNGHAKKKIDDQMLEQDLILMQLAELKEAQNNTYLENKKLQTTNQALSGKLQRLVQKFPDYVDFGGIEFIKLDAVSAVPQIFWKITDYSNGDIVLPEFYFRTTLEDGLAGIGILDSPDEVPSEPVFIPQALAKSPEQVEIFKGFSALYWQQIVAASAVLEQLLLSRGGALQNAPEFDFGFWQNSFATLSASIKRLPKVFRYKQAKLKRELQNPDYEHLWLEFYDVQYGDFQSPKMELRIGASMIEPGGFSRQPKLEFPLVNGKTKPFESWFAESNDDFGQKYELRFSLDKQVIDVTTFLKLAEPDQKMIQSLIFVLPNIIQKMIRSKVSIHRKWDTWSHFVNDTSAIFQKQLRGVKPEPSANETSAVGTPATATTFSGATSVAVPVERRAPPPAEKKAATGYLPVPTRSVKTKSVTVMVAKKNDSNKVNNSVNNNANTMMAKPLVKKSSAAKSKKAED